MYIGALLVSLSRDQGKDTEERGKISFSASFSFCDCTPDILL